MGPVVLAGLGTEYRHDDGVGPAVTAAIARRLPGVVDLGALDGPLELLGRWDGAELAIVVDAVSSGAKSGEVSLLELSGGEVIDDPRRHSTHGLGLSGVLRLASALGAAPARVLLVGIEGERFDSGIGLSPAVAGAAATAAERVVALIESLSAEVGA